MILMLNEVSTDFASWAEGCDCHPFSNSENSLDPESEANENLEALLALESCRKERGFPSAGDGKAFRPCPLAGMRACDLACGAVERQIEEMASLSKQQLMLEVSHLSEEESLKLFEAFDMGKSHLLASMTNKLQNWRMMPWRLAALGHLDQNQARGTAQAIVQEFDSAEQDPNLHHRFTWFLFKISPTFRPQLEAFAGGQPLQSLPQLRRLVAELLGPRQAWCAFILKCVVSDGFFVMPHEVARRQEGDHSLVSRGSVNRRVSGSYVSMLLRMKEIASLFEGQRTTAAVSEFLSEFVAILKPDEMAQRLGLYRHLLYLEAVQEGRTFRDKRKLLGVFLYALDITSQHAILKANKQKREKRAAVKKKVVEKWRDLQKQEVGISSDLVEQSAVSEHLQMFLDRQPSNVMLSVPVSESAALKGLQTSLSVKHGGAPRPSAAGCLAAPA